MAFQKWESSSFRAGRMSIQPLASRPGLCQQMLLSRSIAGVPSYRDQVLDSSRQLLVADWQCVSKMASDVGIDLAKDVQVTEKAPARLASLVAKLDATSVAGCPSCGAGPEHDQVSARRESVPYGDEGQAVDVILPLHTCSACQFQGTDESGSVIRDYAVRTAMDGKGVSRPVADSINTGNTTAT